MPRPSMIRPLTVALLLALSLPAAIAAHAGPPVAATANEVDARFEAIYGKEWT